MAFTNRDRLRKKLKVLPVEVRKAVRMQLRANGVELAEMQRRLVPVDEGQLKAAIKSKDVSTSTRIAVRVSVNDKKARWVEFGTSSREAEPERRNRNFRRTVVMKKAVSAHAGMAARPFFWPSYRALRSKMKRRVSMAARKAIRSMAK